MDVVIVNNLLTDLTPHQRCLFIFKWKKSCPGHNFIRSRINQHVNLIQNVFFLNFMFLLFTL